MQPSAALPVWLFDPTAAYLLFVVGLFAVFVEIAHPGAFVPGMTGLISLSLAIVAFSGLPVSLVGVALIVASIGLMVLDVKAFGLGGLTLVGVGCLVVGSLVLYSRPGEEPPPADVAVAPAVLALVAAVGLLLGLALTFVARSVRRLPPVGDLDELIGAPGIVRTPLQPLGVVHVNAQLWSARVRAGQLEPGHAIRVRARHGLVLEVESATFNGPATNKGALRALHGRTSMVAGAVPQNFGRTSRR